MRSNSPLAGTAQARRSTVAGAERGPVFGIYKLWSAFVKWSALAVVNGVALGSIGGMLGRFVVHATLLGLILLVLGFGAAPQENALSSSILSASITEPEPQPYYDLFVTRGFFASNGNAVSRLADSHTSVPYRTRRNVIVYGVQAGDTVQGIAASFGLQPETLMWSNPAIEDLPDLLRIGQEVVILPIDGVYHAVKEGDTLASIAGKYKVDVGAITGEANEWNGLQPPDINLLSPGNQN